jgi:hypothetical protein
MKKNLTLRIDDEVWRQFQILCINHRITPSTVIEQFMVDNIKSDFKAGNPPLDRNTPSKLPGRPRKFGPTPFRGKDHAW